MGSKISCDVTSRDHAVTRRYPACQSTGYHRHATAPPGQSPSSCCHGRSWHRKRKIRRDSKSVAVAQTTEIVLPKTFKSKSTSTPKVALQQSKASESLTSTSDNTQHYFLCRCIKWILCTQCVTTAAKNTKSIPLKTKKVLQKLPKSPFPSRRHMQLSRGPAAMPSCLVASSRALSVAS